MLQQFRAKFPTIDALEVAVLDHGKPTDEHGYVPTGTGQIIDAATFLALYEPAQPVTDSGRRRGRPPGKKHGRPKKTAAKAAPAPMKRAKKVTAAQPVEVKPERPTIANGIRAAVANGPKDIRAITDYLQTHGHPEVDERQVGNSAYQLRRSGDLTHYDNGTYGLAEA